MAAKNPLELAQAIFTENDENQINEYAKHYGVEVKGLKRALERDTLNRINKGSSHTNAKNDAMEELLEQVANGQYKDPYIFNQAEQDERKKAKKRFIFHNTHDNSYGIDGDPSKYVRFFKDYPTAYDYLSEVESKEEGRRKKLLDDYYGGQGDLEQLHTNILNEFNGNVKAAFEWLLKNGRRY